jgi:hypothetical protein
MRSSTVDTSSSTAVQIHVVEDQLVCQLADGRTISAPISWYPRLLHGSTDERNNWQLIGGGSGVRWPALDEDISIENLLAGKPSGESQPSFKKWLDARQTGS